jgi:polyhydroxybutyrate depolymerase
MTLSHSPLRSAGLTLALAAGLLLTACSASGEGTLRERLKERIAERQAAKEASADPDVTPVTQRIERPGGYRFEIDHGGLKRMYRIHVPQGYSPSRPVPLLFSFHGGGGNMDIQADDRYYRLISKAEEAGYVAVFPNGYSPFPSGKLATWNAGNCCGGARDKNIDDVGFIREVVRHLKTQINVDAQRIYTSGMSNGALFSHRLACEMADTFRGIASVAGSDGTARCQPSRPVNILEIHAKDDDFVQFTGGAGKNSRTLADFVSTPETVARWVRRNACNPTPRRVLDKPGAYCDQYEGCSEGVRVRLCVTETGGHSWPGGVKVRTGEPGSTAFSATDMMWDFFNGR